MFRKFLVAAAALPIVGGSIAFVAPSAAYASVTGPEHFTITTNAVSGPLVVNATGLFTAHGLDNPGEFIDTLEFFRGNFNVDHTTTSSFYTFNYTTCIGTYTASGTYTVASGTHFYAGISGHGTFSLSDSFSYDRKPSHVCQFGIQKTNSETIHANGPITLP